MNTATKSRLAGLPDGLDNGQLGRLAGNSYKSIVPPPPVLSKRDAYRQIIACLAAWEELLDQIGEAKP